MSGASITGFMKPSEALTYAKNNRTDIAFLDIELGHQSGLKLCDELLRINPSTNVIFITAYEDYSLDAWATGASGFILKPISVEAVRKQLGRLRYPVKGLNDD
jgi:two-component SAPR family response regulator